MFTYTVGRTPVKEKAITITIPSGWTPATKDVDDGVNRAGEVELLVNGVLTRDKLVVASRSMKFTGIDPALEPRGYRSILVQARDGSRACGHL